MVQPDKQKLKKEKDETKFRRVMEENTGVLLVELHNYDTDVVFASPSHCQSGQHSRCCRSSTPAKPLWKPSFDLALKTSPNNLTGKLIRHYVPKTVGCYHNEVIRFSPLTDSNLGYRDHVRLQIMIPCVSYENYIIRKHTF